MCHLVDAAAVDAYGCEGHRDADALIEIVDGLYALLGSGSAEDVLAKRRDYIIISVRWCKVTTLFPITSIPIMVFITKIVGL